MNVRVSIRKSINWRPRVHTALVLCATSVISLAAQTLTTLHSFSGADGETASQLVQGLDGNLDGTTYKGGANGYGTIFKITTAGALTTLYSFCSQSGCTDGENPAAALVQALDGDFYGTASAGGAGSHGTVFKVTPSGVLTTLYSFCAQGPPCTDGSTPYSALVRTTNGDLYGTTYEDTVFKITTGGALTTLYTFCSQIQCTDGAYPYAGLVQGTNGDFYGTTYGGGIIVCYQGCGTIFSITQSGTLATLYDFCPGEQSCPDGENPSAGLVQATNGDFYGASYWGGSNQNGTIFEITAGGAESTLHTFCSQGCADGSHPSGLSLADGNLYGTTLFSGAHDGGTIFSISEFGSLTTLYNFCSQSACADGKNPEVPPIQATDGTFYGTTNAGGASGYGTVYSLSLGLGPFVSTLPGFGKVAEGVEILGTDLTGATIVSFNGTAAAFKVVSSTEIRTTVPAGATTGKVQVVTPTGRLSSSVDFIVLP